MTASAGPEGPARREADRATRRLSRAYQDALTVADAGAAGRVARRALLRADVALYEAKDAGRNVVKAG